MEIRQLRTFRAAATLLSFSQAARQLNYAQSSISAQIQSLEEDPGVKLFDRLGKRVELTEAGGHLVQYADKLLDLAEETRAAISGDNEPQGSLNIRIPETLGVQRLPPVLKLFGSKFPKVKLSFTTCAHEDLAADLRKGVTDLAFLLTDSIQAADLAVKRIGFESIHIVSGPDHPLASKKRIRTEALKGATLLLSTVDCSYRKIFQTMPVEKICAPKESSNLAALPF